MYRELYRADDPLLLVAYHDDETQHSITDSTRLVLSMDSLDYKSVKEDFISGLTGTTVTRVNLVSAVALVRPTFF